MNKFDKIDKWIDKVSAKDPVLAWRRFFCVAFLIWVTYLFFGCTIAPKQVIFDKAPNQGLLCAGPTPGTEVVTVDVVAQYNALIGVYGKTYLPPLQTNAGVTSYTNGTYLMNHTALYDYLEMCVKHRNGK